MCTFPQSVILLQEAEAAERSQPAMTATCIACVKAVIDLGIEEEDRKRTWMADADEAIKRGSVETARAIYGHALSVFPGKKSIWRRAAQLEKAKGSKESLDAILKKAVTYCPQVYCPTLNALPDFCLLCSPCILAKVKHHSDEHQCWLSCLKQTAEICSLNC